MLPLIITKLYSKYGLVFSVLSLTHGLDPGGLKKVELNNILFLLSFMIVKKKKSNRM